MPPYLDPSVWGPHYWFFLHTVAMTYPHYPNAVTKKKYYEFIQNLPLFLPVEEVAKDFERLLEEYPITPYLDNRDSFVRWTHFIHNKINVKLEKPTITLNEFYIQYHKAYESKQHQLLQQFKWREKATFAAMLVGLLATIYVLYDK